MFEPLEEQQQWQLEVGLAGLIGELQAVREDAERAEERAASRRQRESELLAEIRDHREQLGLPDTAIAFGPTISINDQESSPELRKRVAEREIAEQRISRELPRAAIPSRSSLLKGQSEDAHRS